LWEEAVVVAQLEAQFFRAGAARVQLDGPQEEVVVEVEVAARKVRLRWGVKVARVVARVQVGPPVHAKEVVEHAEAAGEE